MTYPLSISPDNNQVICNERIAVKAGLVSILSDVIAPTPLPGLLIESVEGACAGTDKHHIPSDRGGREHSATGVELPENLGIGGGRNYLFFTLWHLAKT